MDLPITPRKIAAVTVFAALAISLGACSDEPDVTIGLITKQEINPYWVTMRQVAEETAEDLDVTLLTATGTSDVDVDSQRRALEQMVADGADGILIAPANSSALVPAIEAARRVGVIVIAVDTPVEPLDAVDAFYATDNERAGRLVGEYASVKLQQLELEPQIAMLDLAEGVASTDARRAGFLSGFGLSPDDPTIVATADTRSDRATAADRMSEIISAHPGVNVVYTVNEEAALGALDTLEAADYDQRRTILVSIDGGCQAIKGPVRGGAIDATAMQFPQNMAREGVRALANAIREGETLGGNLDTGVRLIASDPAPGVESSDIEYGVRNCWGD